MSEFKDYTKEASSFTPATEIPRDSERAAAHEMMAGDDHGVKVLNSLKGGVDNIRLGHLKRNTSESIQVDRDGPKATGMEKKVLVSRSSEGEVGPGEVCHFPLSSITHHSED